MDFISKKIHEIAVGIIKDEDFMKPIRENVEIMFMKPVRENVEIMKESVDTGSKRILVGFCILSTALVVGSGMVSGKFGTAAKLGNGRRIVTAAKKRRFHLAAGRGALRNGSTNMDVCVSCTENFSLFYSVGALLYGALNGFQSTTYFETSAMLITFVLLGKCLEILAKGKPSDTIHKLVELAPATAMLLFKDIVRGERLEYQLLVALKERILEHASNFKSFVLKLAPTAELGRPLKLAQIAIGIVDLSANVIGSTEDCPICCEEKPSSMILTMNCLHKFCSHCMRTYVNGKLQTSQVPIRCPQLRCKYYISAGECKSFLPVTCYESLEKALTEANILYSEKMYRPFPNCSVLLNPLQCLLTRTSSSSQSDTCCIECPECQRLICVICGVPWHSAMSCEEYQDLPVEERDAGDFTLHRLALNKKWRRCPQCRRMIELTHGCYHMTCWCEYEFCYSCGAEHREGQQTCQCAFWDEEGIDIDENLGVTHSNHNHGLEQWGWDSFDAPPTITDAYSDQERSQLALIQRFLAGGFSLSDHQPCESSSPRCSDTYVDTIKDLHQLPWLERFVSVISDNYYDDYTQ